MTSSAPTRPGWRELCSIASLTARSERQRSGQDQKDSQDVMEHSELSRLMKSSLSNDEDYERWATTIDPTKLLLLPDTVQTMHGIYDERKPSNEREEIPYTWGVMICRRPEGAGRSTIKMELIKPLARRWDRFNVDAWRPSREGKRTKWRIVRNMMVPTTRCSRCDKEIMDGYQMCQWCGTYCVEFSDLQKAMLYIKLEMLAERMDLTIEQRDFEEAWARGACSRGMGVEKRTERSILAILRDTANHHMKSMEKLGYKDLIDQFHNEAFAAFNAACNGLTPELLCFVTRLACASLPNPGRTREERHSGRMARQRNWRLLVIPARPGRQPQSAVHRPDG